MKSIGTTAADGDATASPSAAAGDQRARRPVTTAFGGRLRAVGRWVDRYWRATVSVVLGGWLSWQVLTYDTDDSLPARLVVVGAIAVMIGAMLTIGITLRRCSAWVPMTAAVVLALAGDVIVIVEREGTGWFATVAMCPFLLGRFRWRRSVPLVLSVLALMALIGLVFIDVATTVAMLGAAAGLSTIGVTRQSTRMRLETAERLLEQERQTREATARAHVLSERSRLAREIHDILAHTLSAQVVELEGVRLMLRRHTDPEQVLAHVDRAQRLARDGLAETRRALESLRGDVLPLPAALARLVAGDQLGMDDVRLEIAEPTVELAPEASLALQRIAQEALTNVRKHAPGAAVRVAVRYPPGACELEITNTSGRPADPKLVDSGGGYGLTGMTERAELLGGTVESGPATVDGERGFRVWARIPT